MKDQKRIDEIWAIVRARTEAPILFVREAAEIASLTKGVPMRTALAAIGQATWRYLGTKEGEHTAGQLKCTASPDGTKLVDAEDFGRWLDQYSPKEQGQE